jgi:hypothetical protein
MSAGRKASINLQNPSEADRFRKMADDVEAGRLPITVMAEEFGVSTKTIRRNMDALEDQEKAALTYREVDSWEHLPNIAKFEAWAKSRGKTPKSRKGMEDAISCAKVIWEKVFKKKNLSLLTEDDMIAFINWKNEQTFSKSRKFGYILALRLLIRFGYGDHNWLERHLGTKGEKGDPRMPPELKSEETFRTVMPRLWRSLDDLHIRQTPIGKERKPMTHYEYEAQHLTLHAKSTLQVRTGDHEEQREWWGTVINNPSSAGSSLLVSEQGKVLHWTVKCKGRETWEIDREAFECVPGLVEEFEKFIHDYQLKTGDYLIDQSRLSLARSREILKQQAKLSELSHYVLHDMRKISATRLILADVRVEDAINFGVGWLDSATFLKHYVAIKAPNMKRAYAQLKAYMSNGGRDSD